MNLGHPLSRILIGLGATIFVALVVLRILLPRVAFEMLIVEGVLEPICWFGLFPALVVGIPVYLVYRLWKWRKGSK